MSIAGPLLRDNLEMVSRREPRFIQQFYELLVRLHPELKGLFHVEDIGGQARMLTDVLLRLLDKYDDEPWLIQNLKALGKGHRKYALSQHLYDWVADALIRTFERVSREEWSLALNDAWHSALTFMTAWMLEGAAGKLLPYAEYLPEHR